jgi:GNAT superfamily N-acetyltransferase
MTDDNVLKKVSFDIDRWTVIASHPFHLYKQSKLIDGASNIEGTWPIFGARALIFYGLRKRQFFYEPLENFDNVINAITLAANQRKAYIPEYIADHLNITFSIFQSAYLAPQGRLTLPMDGDLPRGLHCVRLVGLEDHGEALVFQNSWGRNWGKNGCGVLTREYFERYVSEAWLMRNARYGITRFTYDRIVAATSNSSFRSAWLMENPRFWHSTWYAGQKYHILNYEALSTNDNCPVDVLELRNSLGIRLGWAEIWHLCKTVSCKVSMIKELFVWPPFRNRGYGTILESAARRRAAAWGSDRIAIVLHEGDARPNVRRPARMFAMSRGYEWQWRCSAMPPVCGIAFADATDQTYDVLTLKSHGYMVSKEKKE